MKKYIISGKEYSAKTAEELLEKVRGENSHTKNLSLQDYMNNVAANAINSMTGYNVELPAQAEDIVEVWKKIGMIKEV
jgi:hypothetical protein